MSAQYIDSELIRIDKPLHILLDISPCSAVHVIFTVLSVLDACIYPVTCGARACVGEGVNKKQVKVTKAVDPVVMK